MHSELMLSYIRLILCSQHIYIEVNSTGIKWTYFQLNVLGLRCENDLNNQVPSSIALGISMKEITYFVL